jgi:hypothetical protein
MKRALWLLLAFALLVAGIEALKVLVAWWQSGRPTPETSEWLAFAVFGVAAYAWWRHSIFACRSNTCMLPESDKVKSYTENRRIDA